MSYQFAKKTYSVVLVPTLLALLATACATVNEQQASSSMSAKQTSISPEPATVVEENVPETPFVLELEAMDALQHMGEFLQTLNKFEVDFKISKEVVLTSGQKVMIDGSSQLTVQRPNGLHFSTRIEEAHRDLQFFYDGKQFTIYGNNNKLYASAPAPETIGQLLSIADERYNIELPFADLFAWGTDKANREAILSAIYIGPASVNGIVCDHYAFQNQDVDWQLWIEQGKTPLPRKLVITTKEEAELPQYVSVMNWNLSPKINPKSFTFTPPKDAHKIEFAVNETVAETAK